MNTHTKPCLCGQCGHDTTHSGFRIPAKQSENERRLLLTSLGCDRFTAAVFREFMCSDQVRKSQRISPHHFTMKQQKKAQGPGGYCLKPDAVADIPLDEMVKPMKPCGVVKKVNPSSAKRPNEEPTNTSSKRSSTHVTTHTHESHMSPLEASLCDCRSHDISPHPMPTLPTAPGSSPNHSTATTLESESVTPEMYQHAIHELRSKLVDAQLLIEGMGEKARVIAHNTAQKYVQCVCLLQTICVYILRLADIWMSNIVTALLILQGQNH